MKYGTVFDVQRFSVHDGPGIRTTVFFSGCPLRCRWCHNPEGMTDKIKLRFDRTQCVMCGICENACPNGCHIVCENEHRLDRTRCTGCGKCAAACPAGALELVGKNLNVEELFKAVSRDLPFYKDDGGVTLSGGEPLLQADFCADILSECKKNGIGTAVDTCGCVPRESIDKVLPLTDHFLYDVKAILEDVHIRFTGMSNKSILDNCRYISSAGARLHIRVPVIGSFNANVGEITRIAEFLSSLENLPESVTLIPFHSMGQEKYELFGICRTNGGYSVTREDMAQFREIMLSCGLPIAQ